jgi:hypothetical protein
MVHRVLGVQLQVPPSAVVHEAQMPAERMDTKTVPTKPGRSFPTMQPEHLRRTCTKAKKILSPVGLEPTQISLLECYLQ